LQSLCLDIEVLDVDGNPVELKDDEDAMDTFNLARMDADSDRQSRHYDAEEFQNAGFDVQDAPPDAGADIGLNDDYDDDADDEPADFSDIDEPAGFSDVAGTPGFPDADTEPADFSATRRPYVSGEDSFGFADAFGGDGSGGEDSF
jgi:hypothetical protein